MAEIIPFVPRVKPTTESPIDLKLVEAEIAASLWGMSLCELAEMWQPPYVAPESDPA